MIGSHASTRRHRIWLLKDSFAASWASRQGYQWSRSKCRSSAWTAEFSGSGTRTPLHSGHDNRTVLGFASGVCDSSGIITRQLGATSPRCSDSSELNPPESGLGGLARTAGAVDLPEISPREFRCHGSEGSDQAARIRWMCISHAKSGVEA